MVMENGAKDKNSAEFYYYLIEMYAWRNEFETRNVEK